MEKLINKKKQGSIADALKDAILSGDIPGGTELTQVELADSLVVSRMPVREALIILEYQGLIRRLPNNHVNVVNFDEGFFSSCFGLAADIEIEILKNMDKVDITAESEMLFHRNLYQNCRYAFLSKTLESAVEVYIEYITRNFPSPDRPSQLKEVLNQASLGEWDNVRQLLSKYFSNLMEAYLKEGR